MTSPIGRVVAHIRSVSEILKIPGSTATHIIGSSSFQDLLGDVNKLQLSDSGLHPNMLPGRTTRYISIYEDDLVQVCMFILPFGGVLPLHDHPQMIVISKVLFGKAHISSFNTCDLKDSFPLVTVEKCEDGILDAFSDAAILAPDSGNIHQISSVEDDPCVIFDVLLPPYNSVLSRNCSYYFPESEKPNISEIDVGSRLSLKRSRTPPPWFQTFEQPYPHKLQ